MAKVHIELNSDGIVEMMKSDEIMSVLESHGRRMVSSLGEGYSMSKYPNGKSRGNVSVYADSKEAYQDNLNNNSLLKAVGK